MKQLSDFKPFQRVVLPGVGDLDCAGLILIVGPNSSGKTQLLQDIYQTLSGEARRLVVAQDLEINRPEALDAFVDVLEREGFLTKIVDNNGAVQLRPT